MYIDKIYLIVGSEILFIYFFTSLWFIKSSKLFDLFQSIFNEIKQNKETELIESNKYLLNKSIILKKRVEDLYKSRLPISNEKIIRIMNDILDDNKFTITHFNYYEKKYLHAMDAIKSYQKLCKKSNKYIKKILNSDNINQSNLLNRNKESILQYKEQLDTIKQTNIILEKEIEILKNDMKNKKNNEEHIDMINNLESQIELLNSTIGEYETANQILEFELVEEKDRLKQQSGQLTLTQQELNNIEIQIEKEENGLEDELSKMLERLIVDQHILINRIQYLENKEQAEID